MNSTRARRKLAITILVFSAFIGPTPAAGAETFAYVTSGDNTVKVLRLSDNTVVDAIPVGPNPQGIAMAPNGAFAYVAGSDRNNVEVIRTVDRIPEVPVSVGDAPQGVAITPDGAFAYVTNSGGGTVSVIRLSDSAVIATVPVGASPVGVAITPNGAFAYVTNSGSGTVSVIRIADNTVIATVTIGDGGGDPRGVAITPNGAFTYVTSGINRGGCGGGNVSVIRTADNTVTRTIPLEGGLCTGGHGAIAISPDGAFAYLMTVLYTEGMPRLFWVIRTSDNTLIAKVTFGAGGAQHMAVTPNGDFVYVVDEFGIMVIRTADYTLATTVGVAGRDLAFGPTPVPNTLPLTVTKTGMGKGTVASTPAGIGCGLMCSASFNTGTNITLAATAVAGSTFTGWSGEGCTGTGECIVEMTQVRNVTATFTAEAETFAYVTSGDNTVKVLRLSDNTVVDAIPVGPNPQGIAMAPNGAFAYVAGSDRDNVEVIRTVDRIPEVPVSVGDAPQAVAITPDGAFAYVTNSGGGTVSVIRLSDSAVIATVPVGASPVGVAITPNGAFAYVTNSGSGTVSVIRIADNTVIATVTIGDGGGDPRGVAITPNGTFAYVTAGGDCFGGSVSVIRTADNTVTATIPLEMVCPGAHGGIAVSPDGAFAYAITEFYTEGMPRLFWVIRTSNNTVITKVSFGAGGAQHMAITPNGDFVYVVDQYGIMIIRTADYAFVNTVDVAGRDLAFGPIPMLPATLPLTLIKAGSGSGTVTSNPAGIDCGSTCTVTFEMGTLVTLTTAVAAGSTFAGWSGESCSGTGTCTVSMTQARNVTATFVASPVTTCTSSLSFGQTVSCSIDVAGETDAFSFTATAGDKVLVRMVRSGTGLSPLLRLYGSDGTKLCDANAFGASQTEIGSCPLPSSGTYLISASDGGSGTGGYNLHLQRLNNPGNFVPIAFGQTLSAGIDVLGEIDAYTFTATAGDKVLVRMVETGTTLSPLLRLYGPDGTKLCEANAFGASQTEIGSCSLPSGGTYTILASDGGNGTGGYSLHLQRLNNPGSFVPIAFGQTLSAGIDVLGEIDAYTFTATAGDKVLVRMVETGTTLSPLLRLYGPDGTKLCEANAFGGFQTEIGSCSLPSSGTYTILASDGGSGTGAYTTYLQYLGTLGSNTLTLTEAGTGSGTVVSNPAGINCGTTCSALFGTGTTVTLTATAAGGSTFAGWNGEGCVGAGTCVVAMTQARNVTASFTLVTQTYSLTVTKNGSGSGGISSAPGGIDCGTTCTASFNAGAGVTLTATAATGSVFTGWTGEGCSGTGTCVVAMTQARNVTATFTLGLLPVTLANVNLRFDGGDRVIIPDNPALNPSQITVETWVKLNRISTGADAQFFITKGGDATAGAYILGQGLDADDTLAFEIAPHWNVWRVSTSPLGLETDKWYHVAGTYDGTTLRIYVDGVLKGSKDIGAVQVGNSSPLYLSYDDVGGFPYFLDGNLKEVRIWNIAKTQSDIQSDMYKTLTGNEPGLAAYYPLGEGSGQVVHDYSSNGNHGQLGSTSGVDDDDPTWAFSEDFDFYASGEFPSSGGWSLIYSGADPTFQYVDTARSVSGPQSLRLVGSSGEPAGVYHPLNIQSRARLETRVFVNQIVDCGIQPAIAAVNVRDLSSTATFGGVRFNCDGKVYGVKDNITNILTDPLMAYTAGNWYHVTLDLDLTAMTFDVYVDGVLLGSGIQILNNGTPTGVFLAAGYGTTNPTVWFDDVNFENGALGSSPFTLVVNKDGTGSGAVTSNATGIDCGATCSASFNAGTDVTLTATADTGSTFSGWSGEGCSGTDPCVVAMTQARNVTATFTQITYLLTVSPVPVNGTVTASGINCPGDCTESYLSGTSVTLMANPAEGYQIGTWTGCDNISADTLQCAVQMTQAETVSVTFVPVDVTPPSVVITSHTNNQTVDSSPITISGTASDSGLGDDGISSVTVNGVAASGGTAVGSGTANWSQSVALNLG